MLIRITDAFLLDGKAHFVCTVFSKNGKATIDFLVSLTREEAYEDDVFSIVKEKASNVFKGDLLNTVHQLVGKTFHV